MQEEATFPVSCFDCSTSLGRCSAEGVDLRAAAAAGAGLGRQPSLGPMPGVLGDAGALTLRPNRRHLRRDGAGVIPALGEGQPPLQRAGGGVGDPCAMYVSVQAELAQRRAP